MDTPLSDRVDQQFQAVGLPVHDINGMMRHILDCFGALKVRISEEPFSPALTTTFGNAVRAFVDHITGYDLIDSESGMKFLMESFPDDSKRRDGRNWLPLHWAAAVHNTEPDHLKAILQERPYAVQKGHMPFDNSADEEPGVLSYRGMLPLHFAVAVKHPILPNIRALINARPDVMELPDQRGWLPIHWCAYNSRSPETLRLLITKFPDGVYIANKKGKLPFQLSAYNRSTDIMEQLYQQNPEAVEGLDYNGNTPLHDAAKSFNTEGLVKLFNYKYDFARIRNFREQLPMHKAFSFIPADSSRLHSRHLETINTLLRMNPETASLPDMNDSLPLHLAVYHNSSYEVVEALYNVFPSATLVKDNTGRLPVHYCSDLRIKRLLMKTSNPLSKAGMTDSFSRFATS